MSDALVERYETFRERRRQSVLSAQGSLTLINTQWVAQEQQVWGCPGTWAPRSDGAPGLVLRATAEDNIRVDGDLVDGEAMVAPRGTESPSEVRFSETLTAWVISGQPGFGVRVFDQNSEDAINFSHIDSFDYQPQWVLTAEWREIPGGSLVGFEHLKDEGATRDEVVPGDIILEFDEQSHRLSAFRSGNALQLVFADATSGQDTYSVGRFLFCAPNPDGTITLDFNYAILPPCAFSYQYNCPLPPPNNRLPFAITAGEKQVIARSGELLHPE